MSDLIIYEMHRVDTHVPVIRKNYENFDDASSFFLLAVVCCIISILALAIRCFVPFY